MAKLNDQFNKEARRKNRNDFLFWTICILLLLQQQRNQFAEVGTHHRPPPTFLFG